MATSWFLCYVIMDDTRFTSTYICTYYSKCKQTTEFLFTISGTDYEAPKMYLMSEKSAHDISVN
jgi:hypothetical protein